MSEDKKPFTVSDRRHFTSEGEVRKSDADESASAARPEPEARAERPPDSRPRPAKPVAADAHGAQAGDEAEERGDQFPRDLLGLLVSLGAQASVLLMGGREGEPPDLDSAHALIDLLGDLKLKTEGRRTPPEDQLLDGLLYELRMAYVQATKAGDR